MSIEALKNAIHRADQAINARDFDRLMNFYAEDAMLVIQPGVYAKGKVQIRNAFNAISKYFNDSRGAAGNNCVLRNGRYRIGTCKDVCSCARKDRL